MLLLLFRPGKEIKGDLKVLRKISLNLQIPRLICQL